MATNGANNSSKQIVKWALSGLATFQPLQSLKFQFTVRSCRRFRSRVVPSFPGAFVYRGKGYKKCKRSIAPSSAKRNKTSLNQALKRLVGFKMEKKHVFHCKHGKEMKMIMLVGIKICCSSLNFRREPRYCQYCESCLLYWVANTLSKHTHMYIYIHLNFHIVLVCM